MEAAYNFRLETDGYSETEICVLAKNYKEAENLAKELLKGSKVKLGGLRRVVDARLQVQNTNVTERKLLIEERHLDVKHSGEITEVKVDGDSR